MATEYKLSYTAAEIDEKLGQIQTNSDILAAMFPVGSIYVTSTGDNPAHYLGGTWELIDKHLKTAYYDAGSTSGLFIPTANTDTAGVQINTSGHHISIRLDITSHTETGETNKILGNIDFTRVGATRINNTLYSVSATDTTEATILTELNYSDGTIRAIDVFCKKDSVTTIPIGATMRAVFEATVNTEFLENQFCDKFFWKKVGPINFTFVGDFTRTYQAEQGMTWEQWFESEYNVDNLVLCSNDLPGVVLSVHFNESDNVENIYTITEVIKSSKINESEYRVTL